MPSQCMSISHDHVNPSHTLQSPISDKKNNRQRLASLEKHVQPGLQPCSFQAGGVHKSCAPQLTPCPAAQAGSLVTPPASAFDASAGAVAGKGQGMVLSCLHPFCPAVRIRHGPSRPATSCLGEWQCLSWSCKPLCTEVQQPAQSASLWGRAQPELCPQQ